MPDQLLPAGHAAPRSGRRRGTSAASTTSAGGGMRPRLLRVATLPAVVTTLLGAGAVAFLVLDKPADPVSGGPLAVLAAAAAGCVAVLLVAAGRARAADRWMQRRVEALRSASLRGEQELWQIVEQLPQERRPVAFGRESAAETGDVFEVLGRDLERYRLGAAAALQASASAPVEAPDQRVSVFVNLARRLQSLVHREIQLLDELEAQVEDPDLLKGLFSVDHLATRIRRHAENLAVLGGAVPRRQWTRPVTMYEILRSAVAEVEQYSRVKLVQPTEGNLRGHSIADIVHLIAELVENATMFSAPTTQVLLRAQRVTAGLAIEVEDRGLGMTPEERAQMNLLLADPGQIDIGDLLDDGRIGLFVVSSLARRHGIAVQLQSNIYGGTQAVIVLPNALLGGAEQEEDEPSAAIGAQRQPQQRPQVQQQPQPAPVAPAPVAPAPAARPVATQPGYLAARAGHEPRYAVEHAGAEADHRQVADHRQPPGVRPAPAPAQAAGGGRPLPQREPGALRSPEKGTMPVHHRPTPPEPVRQAEPGHPGGARTGDARPALPRRNQQTHLAPQLRDTPGGRYGAPADPYAEDASDYNPGLMAAFQQGVSRSDAAGRPEDGDPDVSSSAS